MTLQLDMPQLHHRAVVTFVTSGVSATVANIQAFGQVAQVVASCVAVCSGVLAVVYYCMGIRERWRNRDR